MLIMRCSWIDSGSANQTFSSNNGSSQIDIWNENFLMTLIINLKNLQSEILLL